MHSAKHHKNMTKINMQLLHTQKVAISPTEAPMKLLCYCIYPKHQLCTAIRAHYITLLMITRAEVFVQITLK